MKLLKNVARGIVAGIAAAGAMHAFRIAWEAIACDSVRDGIFGFDREADIASAQRIHGILLREPLCNESAARLGMTLHYIYGALLGAAYAAASATVPGIADRRGISAGAVLWLAADEIPITLSRISNPLDKSFASHVSALGAHLLYAATLETILRCWSETNQGRSPYNGKEERRPLLARI